MQGYLIQFLSIIGWGILILLVLLLFIILLVLLTPVCYRIEASAKEQYYTLLLKLQWLAGLVRVRYSYPEEKICFVKILGFTIYRSDQEKRKNHSVDPKTLSAKDTCKEDCKENCKENCKEENLSCHSENPEAEPISPHKTEEEVLTNTSKKSQCFQKTSEEKKNSGKYTSSFTLRDKAEKLLSKITFYKQLLFHEDTQALRDHILMRFIRILKGIRPRRLSGEILFGTGSPDTTGYCLALYSVFYPYYGSTLKVTADFDQKILDGHVWIKGRITVCRLLYHGLHVLLDRKLHQFIRRLKREAL